MINSFTSAALGVNDLILSNPILQTIFLQIFSLPRLIFIKLLEQMPLTDIFGMEIQGTYTVSIELIEFNMSGGSRERAGICVGQINCPGESTMF